MLTENTFDRGVVAKQSTGKAHDHGASLPGGATTGEIGFHVDLPQHVGGFEHGDHAVPIAWGAEVFFQWFAVAQNASIPRLHSDSGHRSFATTGSPPPPMDGGGRFTGHKGVFGCFNWCITQRDGCGF